MTRSKYLPMTKEDLTKFTPEGQHEYQNTFKIKTPRYPLIEVDLITQQSRISLIYRGVNIANIPNLEL